MAGKSVLLNQKWAAEAEVERCAKAMKRDFGQYAEVGEMWIKQTNKAAIFKTHGAVATSLLRWRKADGSMADWTSGRNGDVLMAPVWALNRGAKA
jgi:hypothetical protein